MQAFRGKELLGPNVNDLCLVPNVKVPAKFKVPEFEKYKENSCPWDHLVMYIRRMSTHTDNQLFTSGFGKQRWSLNRNFTGEIDQGISV